MATAGAKLHVTRQEDGGIVMLLVERECYICHNLVLCKAEQPPREWKCLEHKKEEYE